MTFFPFVQGGYRTSECSFFLLRRFVFRLRHLHICHYSPYLPPEILHNLFFFISPGYYSRTKRNWKQCLCKIFGGKYGAWEMCKLRIKRARDWWRIARNHGKEKEERRSGSRPFSPSRLLFPANFYRERERETVYVRGTEFTLPNFSEVWTKLAKFLVTLRLYTFPAWGLVLPLCDKFQRNI